MKISLYVLTLVIFCLGACTYTERIKDGKTAYERKQYAVAIPMLEKEFNKEKERTDKGERAYLLAESYRKTNQIQEAADWYKKASDNLYTRDSDLKRARMLQQLQDYDLAIQAFRSAGRYNGDVRMYEQEIIACRKAKQWLKQEKENAYTIESLPFNTPATDYAAVVQGADKILFSSDREQSEGEENYKWTGKKFFDFYTIDFKEGKVNSYEVSFDKNYHQGAASFNTSRDILFFTQCGSEQKEGTDYCKIMRSEKVNGQWSKPEEVQLGDPSINYMHPLVTEDGNGLYFAMNTSEGFGGYDLYFTFWVPSENRWAKPRNLGSTVNSKGNEVFPFLEKDTLYFASDGHPGMGGLDVFRVEKKQGRWKKLKNLQAPINSGGDDFAYVIDTLSTRADTVMRMGYLTSSRLEGKGGDDIYRFRQAFPPPPDTTKNVPEAFVVDITGFVKERVYKILGDPNSGLDSLSFLMGASVQVSTKDTVFTLGSDFDGSFSFEADTGVVYNFRATKEGYFSSIGKLSTEGIAARDTTLEITLEMDRLIKNQEIVLENIYYDFNKDNIREDARPTLDSLVQILKQNPGIRIQLASHTDCRGSASYNEDLSQRRAESAVRYLIQKEILDTRLEAKGYGENKPSNDCKCNDCSEEEHQANRRTTFMVLD